MTPEVEKKKLVSARSSVRKASAKKSSTKVNGEGQSTQKTFAFPQTQSQIQTVPVVPIFGQKSLKTHTSSNQMISSSPEKLAAKQAEH